MLKHILIHYSETEGAAVLTCWEVRLTKDINYLDSNEAQSCWKTVLSMSHLWPRKFTVQEFVKIR